MPHAALLSMDAAPEVPEVSRGELEPMNAVPAFDCFRCEDVRRVWNKLLAREIRCPACTTVRPNRVGARELAHVLIAMNREQAAIDNGEAKLVSGVAVAISLLCEWGRWVRGRGIGYPPMSTIERAIYGRGGGEIDTPLPPDLEAVDRAVSTAPIELKTVLIEHYTKAGFATVKAAHLGIPRRTYYERKASGERHVANAIGV